MTHMCEGCSGSVCWSAPTMRQHGAQPCNDVRRRPGQLGSEMGSSGSRHIAGQLAGSRGALKLRGPEHPSLRLAYPQVRNNSPCTPQPHLTSLVRQSQAVEHIVAAYRFTSSLPDPGQHGRGASGIGPCDTTPGSERMNVLTTRSRLTLRQRALFVAALALLLWVGFGTLVRYEERAALTVWSQLAAPPNAGWQRMSFTPWTTWGLGARTTIGGPLRTTLSKSDVAAWYQTILPTWKRRAVGGNELLCYGQLFLYIEGEAGLVGVTIRLEKYTWRFRNAREEPRDTFTQQYRC